MVFRHTFGKALCELRNEEALARAEQLVTPMLESVDTKMMGSVFLHEILARVALGRGQMERALTMTREAMKGFFQAPVWLPPVAAVQIHALIGLQRAAEAVATAEQILAMLPVMGSVGLFEIEFRVAASEAFHAHGDRERAHAELRDTLRQIQLRADDITDQTWKQSYLTRNPHCVRAQQLAAQWQLAEVRSA
jgi:hypothetical protein